MKIPRTLVPVLTITILLVVIPLLIITTPIGHIYLGYFVNKLAPDRHLKSLLAKSYQENPAQFEDVATKLIQEPYQDIIVSRLSDKGAQITSASYQPLVVKPETTAACNNLMEKLKLVSITKKNSKILFSQSLGEHDKESGGLVYDAAPQPESKKASTALNEHWSVNSR